MDDDIYVRQPSPLERARVIMKAWQERRMQDTMAVSRGAEKLQELATQFNDLRGEYAISTDLARNGADSTRDDADVPRNDAGQLRLQVRANDRDFCTWGYNRETLIGEFKGSGTVEVSTASEAFDQTMEVFAMREAGFGILFRKARQTAGR